MMERFVLEWLLDITVPVLMKVLMEHDSAK